MPLYLPWNEWESDLILLWLQEVKQGEPVFDWSNSNRMLTKCLALAQQPATPCFKDVSNYVSTLVFPVPLSYETCG